MSYDTQRPFIAIYLIFKNKDNQVAFLKRSHTSWMNGYYCLPAGKVEDNESYIAAAIREGKEEVGVDIKRQSSSHKVTVHRNSQGEDMQWVDVFFEVLDYSGELSNAEPHMHSELTWFDLGNLPTKITPPIVEALECAKQGKTYLEVGFEQGEGGGAKS